MDDSLDTILGNAGVDPTLASNLVSDGWTVTSFREIAASPSDFTDQVFAELCHDVSLSLLQKSCIKGAWRSLQTSQIQEANTPSGTSSAAGMQAATDNTWSESFPPKLTSSTVSQLKMKFCANFPSEVVTPETQPSARLLALAFQLHQKKEYKWLPWKYRMSIARSEEMSLSRASKAPRLENVQLHQLLIDEIPSLEITNQNLGLNAVNRMFDLHNYAWAMVQACHLHRLRSYSLKFMSFLSVRLDAESGLRAPSILEAQHADKHIWHLIAELCESPEWTLDDALLEFTQNRGDLAALLQPRPKLMKPTPPPSNTPFKGGKAAKSSGKGGKPSKGSGKSSVRWVSELWKGSQKKTLCMRFQTGKCSNKDCRYEHACGYPRADGTACGASHPAMDFCSKVLPCHRQRP